MQRLGKSFLLFVAIGLAIYGLVYYAADQLVYRTGRSNPFFKVATAERRDFDWVILGASHAMPLDFADFNALMQRETGLRIINLASPGTGPLYNRFVFEQFLREHHARKLLYVVDSFAFYSPIWNEDRFADAKLIRRTPWDPSVAQRLLRYSIDMDIDPRAVLDYVSGFSKINNRERFELDIWEGEKQFDRVYRPSTVAIRNRIEYLYPNPPEPAAIARYLREFETIAAIARQHDMAIVAIKLPLLSQFRARIPDEAAFDREIAPLLADNGIPFHDFSQEMDQPAFYFDTDHLNRPGLTEFFRKHFKAILLPPE